MAERDAGLEMLAVAVRPAMTLRVVHTAQQRTVRLTAAANVDDSGNATHDGQDILEVGLE
jgi:hypothetical protein